MIHQRRVCPEIGFGDWRPLEVDEPSVLALRSDWEGGVVVTLHNMSGAPRRVKVDLDGGDHGHRLVEVLAGQQDEPLEEAAGTIPLAPYGYRWFRTEVGSGVASTSAPRVVSSTRLP
jgi:maltose alpha-D-glucosyltransferase/alpha-amylase